MPSMANITVKDINNVDVVLTGIARSSGDKTPARWEATALSGVPAFRPRFELISRDSGSRTGRVWTASAKCPILLPSGIENLETVGATAPFGCHFTIPQNVDSARAANMFYLFANWLSSPLVKECVVSGYSAV